MDLAHLDSETALQILRLQLSDIVEMQTSMLHDLRTQVPSGDTRADLALMRDMGVTFSGLTNRAIAIGVQVAEIKERFVVEHNIEALYQRFTDGYYRGLFRSALVHDANRSNAQPGPLESPTQVTPREPKKPKSSPCIACGDTYRISTLVSGACAHYYCAPCIKQLVTTSLTDESMFPPRCCGEPTPLEGKSAVLGGQLSETYEAKKIEFETVDRTYCSGKNCSFFVPPSAINGRAAVCSRCNATTCKDCKAEYHSDTDCATPEDGGLEKLLELAEDRGWQQCKKCSRVLELNTGCYHMSKLTSASEIHEMSLLTALKLLACVCGAQFCYLCGVKWKQCRCQQWDEARLVGREN